MLGHSRIDTTARYTAVSPQTVGRTVSPLDCLPEELQLNSRGPGKTKVQSQPASGLTRVDRPALEVADVFRRHGAAYRTRHRLPLNQHRLMRAI